MPQLRVFCVWMFGLLCLLAAGVSVRADIKLYAGAESNLVNPLLATIPSDRDESIYFDFLKPFLDEAQLLDARNIQVLGINDRSNLINRAWAYRDAVVLAAKCMAQADENGVCESAELSALAQSLQDRLSTVSGLFVEAQASRTALRMSGNDVMRSLGIESVECTKELRRRDQPARERAAIRADYRLRNGRGEALRPWSCVIGRTPR